MMSENTNNLSKMDNQVQKQHIPVKITDLSIFDDRILTMKERFSKEIKRLDRQMFDLSKALASFYNRNLTVGVASTKSQESMVSWDDIASSPLVEGDGDEMMLKLQFDVSQFSPDEIEVEITDNLLSVTAIHDEEADNFAEHREYHRYFALPTETDPKAIVSSLSRDGILTVHAPLVQPARLRDEVVRARPIKH